MAWVLKSWMLEVSVLSGAVQGALEQLWCTGPLDAEEWWMSLPTTITGCNVWTWEFYSREVWGGESNIPFRKAFSAATLVLLLLFRISAISLHGLIYAGWLLNDGHAVQSIATGHPCYLALLPALFVNGPLWTRAKTCLIQRMASTSTKTQTDVMIGKIGAGVFRMGITSSCREMSGKWHPKRSPVLAIQVAPAPNVCEHSVRHGRNNNI